MRVSKMINYKVCVVTVTYGNRWKFLKQVLERVLEFEQVAKIVVVNNASSDILEAVDNRIILLNNNDNLGSAGGYHQGIAYAYNHVESNFVWLLDDDNMPAEDCLLKLLQQWDMIEGEDNKKALFCLRDDRAAHVKIAKGASPDRYYLVKDNFLGFHLFRVLKNQYNKTFNKEINTAEYKERVTMPYVPYGGLLLHKKLIADIGFPDERFYLYVDDSEYSYRITQNNGTIWMIPSCRVIDIDKSQGINYKKKLFHSQLLDEWSFRTYYHIRNRMYFYSRVAIKNKFMFTLNKVLYLAFLKIISVTSSKKKEYNKLLIAINDGLNNNLGKADPDKF